MRRSARRHREQYQRAKQILVTNLDKLHAMAKALIKYETIDDEQLKDIMDGKPPQPPAGWDDAAAPNKQPPTPRKPAGQPGPIGFNARRPALGERRRERLHPSVPMMQLRCGFDRCLI